MQKLFAILLVVFLCAVWTIGFASNGPPQMATGPPVLIDGIGNAGYAYIDAGQTAIIKGASAVADVEGRVIKPVFDINGLVGAMTIAVAMVVISVSLCALVISTNHHGADFAQVVGSANNNKAFGSKVSATPMLC